MQMSSPPQLSEKDIHVWTLRTRAPGCVVAKFEPLLDPDERARAARFRFSQVRESFVMARGFLRTLLGHYVAADPRGIRFDYGSKGKPALASASGIQFNLADSGDMAAIAFTVDCQIGIDLEQIRQLPDLELIAERFFCSEEVTEIMSLSPAVRERAFFRGWTRMEAYIKATGEGLSLPLDSFRVTVQPDASARLIHLGGDREAAEAWTLHDLYLASDYAATVAYQDRKRSLAIFSVADPTEFLGRS